MAAHAKTKPKKGLRAGIGVAATASAVLGGIFFFGTPALAAPTDDTTSTAAPAAPAAPDPQTSTPAAGSPSSDQQQSQQAASTQSTDQASQASTPSEAPAAPVAPAPAAPAPAPAPAPAAPAASAPDTSSAGPNAPPQQPAPAQKTLTTQPLPAQAPAPKEDQLTDFTIDRIPATVQKGEYVIITAPTPENFDQLACTTIQVDGQDLPTLEEFLQKAVGVADHDVTFVVQCGPAEGYVFPGGQPFWKYSGTLDRPIPGPQTVDNPNWLYTYNPATGATSVTVTGGNSGQLLTTPLSIRAAAWKGTPQAKGTPPWPQTLYGYNDLVIDRIGTYEVTPPQLKVCYQYDIYASFDGFGALALPSTLNGPNNPYEPSFLHTVLAGKGPNPTYSYSSDEGCNPPPPPPTVVTPAQPTVHDWCGVEHDGATPPADTDQIAYSTAGGHLSARLKLPNTVWAKDLGPHWSLGEDGTIYYTLITTPTPCLPKPGQDVTRVIDCSTSSWTVTTTPWSIPKVWDDKTQSDVDGAKVYGTPVVTHVPLTDTEKATCPTTVVTQQNPPTDTTIQEVSSTDQLAHTGSDVFGPLWLALFLLGLGVTVSVVVSRRKAAASK